MPTPIRKASWERQAFCRALNIPSTVVPRRSLGHTLSCVHTAVDDDDDAGDDDDDGDDGDDGGDDEYG